MTNEELDTLASIVRRAGIIKVHDGSSWGDLRLRLVEVIELLQATQMELEATSAKNVELEERIQRVANNDW
jgi:hypothetical protein